MLPSTFFGNFAKKTKFIKPSEADLIIGINKEIEEHEYNYYSQDGHNEAANNWIQRLFGWIF